MAGAELSGKRRGLAGGMCDGVGLGGQCGKSSRSECELGVLEPGSCSEMQGNVSYQYSIVHYYIVGTVATQHTQHQLW